MERRSVVEKAMEEMNGGSAYALARRNLDDPVYRAAIGDLSGRDNIARIMGTLNTPDIQSILGGTVGAIARDDLLGITKWQKELAGLDNVLLGRIAGQQSAVEEALQGIMRRISAPAKALQEHVSGVQKEIDKTFRSLAGLDLTNKRFAALAGITDTFGVGELHRQATETLLGHWHTSLDLPNDYWNDIANRPRLYREADVDEGLIEAEPETAIELGIASGAIVGEITEHGRYVVGETASGLLTLTTANLDGDVFKLVGTIETALRKLIARKLKAFGSDQWFKQRVPGHIAANAKENRRKALKGGESTAPLIEFVTLGELMQIIVSGTNWESVFEPIFRSRERFQADIEVIGIARNPNAHYRPSDALWLAEVMIVWTRLQHFIDDNGQWAVDADCDE